MGSQKSDHKQSSTNQSKHRSSQHPQNDAPIPGMTPEEFERLCATVDKTVSSVTDAIGKGLGKGLGGVGSAIGGALGQAASALQQNFQDSRQQALAREQERARIARINARFDDSSIGSSGMLMTLLGGLGVAGAGITTVALLVFTLTAAAADVVGVSWVMTALAAVVAGLCGWMLGSGVKRLHAARWLKQIKHIFGDRELCNLSELAVQTNSSPEKTLEETQTVLKYGLLPEGHLDDDNTCLMVTNDAYGLYRQVETSRKQQAAAAAAREEQERAKNKVNADGLDSSMQAFIDQGNDYLEQMRQLDIAIDDEAVSNKIVAIEDVVGRILHRSIEEPRVISGLGKLMDYYLPTTVRLLSAYDDLEDQPIQGETISQSRLEIERTLDVLISAYEKLLDATFQDLSLDVSADIDVLHAMLAQEGLTPSPFDMKTQK